MKSPARRVALAVVMTLFVVGAAAPAASQAVFINEIHYDNNGTDAGEAVEVAGPAGTDLTGWTIVPYNGNGGVTYTPIGTLSGTIPNLCGGFGVVSVSISGLQNGAPDGIALVNGSSAVVQFLSYEGSFAATNGPAIGMTSTDIGVSENGTEPIGLSLQLAGTGSVYSNFTWQIAATSTFGACNTGQTFVSPDPKINEFSASTAGTDVEYVEIYGLPNTDFSGYRILEIEGDAGTAAGTIDEVITVGTTSATGFWLGSLAANSLENATLTLLLVEGFSGAIGNDLDTNDDGVLDTTPWTRIVDAVAVNDGGAGDLTYGVPALGVAYDGLSFAPGGASRIPNGADTNTAADWVRNDFDLAGIPTFTGTPIFGEAYNTPNAVNQAVPAELAPTVASTTPANGATGFPGAASLTVTFSEAVNVTANWFQIVCANSGTRNSTDTVVSGGPTTFTINPNTDFAPSESCTATILAAQVTDQDATDPPDTMALDFAWSFTTAAAVVLTPIHDIQGPGASSPIGGSSVTTTGIVTGRRSNGFFIQEPDATVDADPATSEGILVFTSSAPPAAAAVGALVQVSGTISEYVPTADPQQPPLTELTSPVVVQLSTGNPLPAPISLNATFPDPAGPFDQLERLEGMRVTVPSLTVVGPSLGNVDEPNATASSTGVFYGVVTGVARPFREAGIRPPDAAPSGTIPPIPRWDGNPELIRVDSDAIGAATLDVGTGAVVSNVTGPLDYTFRYYTILPDSTPPVAGGPTAVAVATPLASEVTVASYNVERFFDTVNDPGIGEPVLTSTAFDNRLAKASLAIRDFLKTPDILGVVEVENLTTLQALATRINTDAGAQSPQYVAYLVEGNDPGGIDVGFLVKTAPVVGATPRVGVVEVQQELDGTLFVNPDSSTATLNDRPPLRLNAVVNHANGATFPITVIVNHLRSLNGVDDAGAGSNGWPTEGARIRAKRLKQAEDLANLVQTRQTADPAERIVLVGDFNAFEFNDGFGHSMATIAGTPVPDNETAVSGDGADLVNPDLVNLFDTPPATERYSFVFDGSAQSLDHVVVNEDVVSGTLARRLEHPRVNADFPAIARNDTASATRLADHDPVVAFFQVAAFASAGITTSISDAPDPVFPGAGLTYTVNVTNGGPDPATGLSLSIPIPAGTVLASFAGPFGWTCSSPAVGTTGTATCSTATLPSPGGVVFVLGVTVDAGVTPGTILTCTATVTQTSSDPDASDDAATATTTVQTPAAVYATKAASGSFVPGSVATYTIDLHNTGSTAQLDNPGDELTDVLPAPLVLVSASATSGTAVATVATNTVTWNGSVPAGGTVTITITAGVPLNAVTGSIITNQATISYDADGNGTNEAAGVSDDPATGTAGDATGFAVGAAGAAVIPALDGFGLGLLAALVALGGVLLLGRRLS